MFDSTLTQQRSAFSDGDLATASPRRVLVKCFDRLDIDLEQALEAIETNDAEAANRLLGHAQDLLGEVAGMLDVDAWQHSGDLLAIYDYVLRLLAVGNMQKAPSVIHEARRLLAELGEAFRDAAQIIEKSGTTTPPVPSAPSEPEPPASSRLANAFGDGSAQRQSFSALA